MEKDSKGDVENVKASVASSIRGKDVDFDQLVFQLLTEYLLIHYSRLDFFGVSVCGLWIHHSRPGWLRASFSNLQSAYGGPHNRGNNYHLYCLA
ncbi:hypothetical protein LIER_33487 [Lithospermum erythrorhizon]|uniref:Uncharacterized protein n=1 Tax=Lithospermum erythrorhizon TaxID=34254 RepID=A0AAV3S0L2_LITER